MDHFIWISNWLFLIIFIVQKMWFILIVDGVMFVMLSFITLSMDHFIWVSNWLFLIIFIVQKMWFILIVDGVMFVMLSFINTSSYFNTTSFNQSTKTFNLNLMNYLLFFSFRFVLLIKFSYLKDFVFENSCFFTFKFNF